MADLNLNSTGITGLPEFQPETLSGIVDETVANTVPAFVDRFLPNENIFSPSFAYDIFRQNPAIAAYVGYGSEPPIMDRDEVARATGNVAKMGHKYEMTYEELMALHQPRTNDERQALIDKLTFKNIRMVENIQKLVAVSKWQALATGKFVYNRNGVKLDVDYKIPAKNRIVLTESKWSDAAHDVIGDLLKWNEQYIADNNKQADAILMTRETQALLLKNTVIVQEARPNINGASRVSVDELTSVLGGYDLPPISIVSERFNRYVDDYTGEHVVEEIYPINRIIFISEDVGRFYFGPTLENNMKPGIKLFADDLKSPIRSVVEVHAAGFPVIMQPSLLLYADVFDKS